VLVGPELHMPGVSELAMTAAEVGAHLALQDGLQHELDQPGQHPVPADQLTPVGLRRLDQPTHQGPLLLWHLLLVLLRTAQTGLPPSGDSALKVSPQTL
jgi:hypothetical protein